MNLLFVLLVLLAIALLLWMVSKYLTGPAPVKVFAADGTHVVNVLIILVIVYWILRVLGLPTLGIDVK
jgi:hypothetical protein